MSLLFDNEWESSQQRPDQCISKTRDWLTLERADVFFNTTYL